MAELKYRRCKFIARLDNQSLHNINIIVEEDVPYEYIWFSAIRKCDVFNSPLQQLSFVEEVKGYWNDFKSMERDLSQAESEG